MAIKTMKTETDKMDMRSYVLFMASLTVAHEYFQQIKHPFINQVFEATKKSLKALGYSEGKLKYELKRQKTIMQRDYNIFDVKINEMIKKHDDNPDVNVIVQYIHDVMDEIKVDFK
jgi:hypothetical protein